MHRVAYRNGDRVSLDPSKLRGKGGEAYIYETTSTRVAKIFKDPDDPDYELFPDQQKGAERRIAMHQTKLREFPFARLPQGVVVPLDLLTDISGRKILGYEMEYLIGYETLMQYLDRDFREKGGIGNNEMMQILRELHPIVKKTHEAGVVISDFNSLNVLVKQLKVKLCDADSMGNSKYLSPMFTAAYVDPLHCDPKLKSLMMVKPHDALSDWYALNVMAMEGLLYVRPWGGVYKPKDKKKMVPLDARPLRGISVFHSEVVYPKPANPLNILPDDFLDYLFQTFEKGLRGEYPVKFLDIHFSKCVNCGYEHSRGICPSCSTGVPAQKMTQVRGSVRVDFAFQTPGVIIFSTVQKGELKYLYNLDGKFLREDGSVALEGKLDSSMRYRIQGKKTIVAKNGLMIVLENGKAVEKIVVDSYGNLPLIDANSKHYYWSSGGLLYRNESYGPEIIGNVLEGQTLFWAGEKFGFGFYRAGELTRAFVFDADRSGINDTVKIVPVKGQLIDSTCVFSGTHAWFMTTEKSGSKIINRVQVINALGEIQATEECENGDGSWLGKIRGKLPIGNFILSATNDGIVRTETVNGKIVPTKEFPDTEPFVDENSFLLPSSNGIYVVRKKEILSMIIR